MEKGTFSYVLETVNRKKNTKEQVKAFEQEPKMETTEEVDASNEANQSEK